MCGLFGVISNAITIKEENIFKELAIVSNLRGVHSTGVGVVRSTAKQWEYFIAKSTGHAFDLFDTKQFDVCMNLTFKRVLMGHARYATRGKINRANAHPFIQDEILGAHNGTVHNGIINSTSFGTDSEGIMSMLNEPGVHVAIPMLQGAWALTWFDFRNGTFNILRNRERSLYFAVNKNNDALYYASEVEMLELVLTRNGVQFEDIYSFATDTLYSWDMGEHKFIDTLEKKEVKGKEVVVTPHTPFRDTKIHPITKVDSGKDGTSKTTKIVKDGVTQDQTLKPYAHYHVRHSRPHKVGYNNEYISEDHYNNTLNNGCAWCSDNIIIGDKYKWIDRQTILCEACNENESLQQLITTDYEGMKL